MKILSLSVIILGLASCFCSVNNINAFFTRELVERKPKVTPSEKSNPASTDSKTEDVPVAAGAGTNVADHVQNMADGIPASVASESEKATFYARTAKNLTDVQRAEQWSAYVQFKGGSDKEIAAAKANLEQAQRKAIADAKKDSKIWGYIKGMYAGYTPRKRNIIIALQALGAIAVVGTVIVAILAGVGVFSPKKKQPQQAQQELPVSITQSAYYDFVITLNSAMDETWTVQNENPDLCIQVGISGKRDLLNDPKNRLTRITMRPLGKAGQAIVNFVRIKTGTKKPLGTQQYIINLILDSSSSWLDKSSLNSILLP